MRWSRIHRIMAVGVVVVGQIQSWSGSRGWLRTGSRFVGRWSEARLGVQYGWLRGIWYLRYLAGGEVVRAAAAKHERVYAHTNMMTFGVDALPHKHTDTF